MSLQSSWVSDDEVLKILREIWIPESCSRPNVANYKNQAVASLCIGLSARSSTLTSRAYELEAVYRVLNRWLRQQVTEEEFGYTSITINRDHASSLHRDIGNAGPSVIRTLGVYEGGVLHYFPQDDGMKPLEELNDIDAVKLDTSKFCIFDGNKGHGVTPFVGERYSIIWFSTVTAQSLCAQEALEIIDAWQA